MPAKRITSVTTRHGDRGETSLADGSSIAKSAPQIQAIGSVDELNSFVGVLVSELTNDDGPPPAAILATMERLQQELFDIGAHLATVGKTPAPDLEWLEAAIKEFNSQLPPLTEFVIPGGTREAAMAHVCRTVCRRAERHCWEVEHADAASRYLNRLSDLLFVIARLLNHGTEPQWRGPAGEAPSPPQS